jgi:hypothetical protein
MRLFLMGDSFTENLFEIGYNDIGRVKTNPQYLVSNPEICQYLIRLEQNGYEKAKYFEDLLVDMGYEVYNFAKSGCTIEDIIYQFLNLSKFESRDDDRIILNCTHPSRFNWIKDDGEVHYVHLNSNMLNEDIWRNDSGIVSLIMQQNINREESFFDGYLNRNLLPFMEYLIEIHNKYKPIVWTPFADLDKTMVNQKWFFSFINEKYWLNFLGKLPHNLSIIDETNGLFKDYHFGRYGNYYIATLFDEIIKNNLGPTYADDTKIFDIVLRRIERENKIFKI